jgi:hypothetical protein
MKYRYIWNALLIAASIFIGVRASPLVIAQANNTLPIFGGKVVCCLKSPGC